MRKFPKATGIGSADIIECKNEKAQYGVVAVYTKDDALAIKVVDDAGRYDGWWVAMNGDEVGELIRKLLKWRIEHRDREERARG